MSRQLEQNTAESMPNPSTKKHCKPTIAIIDPLGRHGGLHYYVDGMARGLSENGYRVITYVTDFTGISPQQSYESEVAFGELYGHQPNYIRGVRFLLGIFRAVLSARSRGVHVVNLHAFRHDFREALAIWSCRLAGLQVILTVHDIESFGSNRSSTTQKLCLAGVSAFIFQNKFSKSIFEKKYTVNKMPVGIIPHGHYIDAYPQPPGKNEARSLLGFDPETFLLLFFGNPREEKGLDLLIATLSNWKGRLDWKLVIAGKMKPTQKKSIENLITRSGLTDQVRIDAGHISDSDTPLYYRAADIVVVPYRKIYESGVTIMAMSMGRPAIVSNHEPLTDKIIEGITGFVFESGVHADLAAALDRAYSQRNRLDVLGDAAFQQVKKNRAWTNIGGLFGEFASAVHQRHAKKTAGKYEQ